MTRVPGNSKASWFLQLSASFVNKAAGQPGEPAAGQHGQHHSINRRQGTFQTGSASTQSADWLRQSSHSLEAGHRRRFQRHTSPREKQQAPAVPIGGHRSACTAHSCEAARYQHVSPNIVRKQRFIGRCRK